VNKLKRRVELKMENKDIHDKMNLKGLSYPEKKELVPSSTILLGFRGSIAHGMYLDPSRTCGVDDKDILGVYVAPLSCYIGLSKYDYSKEDELNPRGAYEVKIKDWDAVHYEVIKFVKLLLQGNPNVLMMLWLNERHYIYINKISWALVLFRDIFKTKKVYHSFTGYAYDQLHKMEHANYEGYMGEKRKQLVEKFGYDTKNAAHLIRLLRMGIEFLSEGILHVEREDAPQLLEIKNGEWKLEKVKSEAEKLFSLAQEAYVRSTLPPEPDYKKADKLVMNMVSSYYNIPFDGWHELYEKEEIQKL
jgi:predicted nucleotidyltransferase